MFTPRLAMASGWAAGRILWTAAAAGARSRNCPPAAVGGDRQPYLDFLD